jgi:hypothetical protein
LRREHLSSQHAQPSSQLLIAGNRACYVVGVKLADCVAQCRTPFVVQDRTDGRLTILNNTADCAEHVAKCPIRYVLTDDLTGLCADLAYSKGARTVTCADLLHVPAEVLWVEWCNQPWQGALQRYGFRLVLGGCQWVGRRGALIRASPDGRRGLMRTFWTAATERDVLASSIEAYFDFDTLEGEEPEPPDWQESRAIKVYDGARAGDDVLARCFRFRYERTWSDYYGRAGLSDAQSNGVWRHALGTIAMDVPMLLAFFLLLATRSGLPQRVQTLQRLNRSRRKSGKEPLLDHIEVRAPLLPQYRDSARSDAQGTRRGPRLHHVRGHLVRRGSQIFWRVPHLRGSARSGVVRTRTVVWTFDDSPRPRGASNARMRAGGRLQ